MGFRERLTTFFLAETLDEEGDGGDGDAKTRAGDRSPVAFDVRDS